MPPAVVSCFVSFRSWHLGFQVHDWGVRIMLITYHACIHVRRTLL